MFLRRAHVHTHINNRGKTIVGSRRATSYATGFIRGDTDKIFIPFATRANTLSLEFFPQNCSFVRSSFLDCELDSIKWHVDVPLWHPICHTIRVNVIVSSWNGRRDDRWIGRILESEKNNYFQVPRESRSMDKFLRRVKMRLSFILTTSTHTKASLYFSFLPLYMAEHLVGKLQVKYPLLDIIGDSNWIYFQ